MTFKLGLTGSIGMGKSTTARIFADQGCGVWDADAAVHKLYGENGAAVAPLAAIFPQVLKKQAICRTAIKQLISDNSEALQQIEKIVGNLKPNNFKIIPCLLIPSQKNLKSAEFLKIDWSNYKEDIIGFINEIHSITGDVLITSPNDFKRAYETISKLAS